MKYVKMVYQMSCTQEKTLENLYDTFQKLFLQLPSAYKLIFSIHPRRSLLYIYIYIYIYTRGAYDKFLDFFRIGIFIDSTHMKL